MSSKIIEYILFYIALSNTINHLIGIFTKRFVMFYDFHYKPYSNPDHKDTGFNAILANIFWGSISFCLMYYVALKIISSNLDNSITNLLIISPIAVISGILFHQLNYFMFFKSLTPNQKKTKRLLWNIGYIIAFLLVIVAIIWNFLRYL